MERYRYEQEEPIVVQQDIHFFYQKLPAAGRFSTHLHSAVEILFIQRGFMTVLSEDAEFRAESGSTVLIRANTVHTGIAGEDGCVYWVLKVKPSYLYDLSFRDKSSRYLLDFTLNRAGKKILWTAEESGSCGISAALQGLIREAEGKEYGYDVAMKVYASTVLLALLRGMQIRPALRDEGEQIVRNVYDTILWINEHYREDLTAEACADRCYLSYSYFSRNFRKITGKTFRNYLNSVRLDHAERELISTRHPVTRVAADCGFNNVAYFIALFRERKGMTPLAFRKEFTEI